MTNSKIDELVRITEDIGGYALELRPQHPPVKVWALVAVGLDGGNVVMLDGNPMDWWEDILMGDSFSDVGPQNVPTRPGIYRFHGHFVPNRTAGKAMPNGDVDDYPGEWIGDFTYENMEKLK